MQSKVPMVSDKEDKKKNNFISFILKRRSKIILETGNIIRLLGQKNSLPLHSSRGKGTGAEGKKGKQWFYLDPQGRRDFFFFFFNSLTQRPGFRP